MRFGRRDKSFGQESDSLLPTGQLFDLSQVAAAPQQPQQVDIESLNELPESMYVILHETPVLTVANSCRNIIPKNPMHVDKKNIDWTLRNRLLFPHLFLSTLYDSYSRLNGYSYNKKADLRNRNNFIHFG